MNCGLSPPWARTVRSTKISNSRNSSEIAPKGRTVREWTPDCPRVAQTEEQRRREKSPSPKIRPIHSQINTNCHQILQARSQGNRGATSKRSSPNLEQNHGKSKEHNVTKPPNYTRLSRKIIQQKDNLTNLSSYNPVVREISTDFKPFHITAKIVLSSAVTIISYMKVRGIKYIGV
jgi:hypothetical protein